MLILIGAFLSWAQDERAQDKPIEPLELSPAKIGVPYAYALETSRPAYFEKAGGNAAWLIVTAEGVLTGTPPGDAPPKSEIIVYAHPFDPQGNVENRRFSRTFVVPVQKNPCTLGNHGDFRWCSDETARRQQSSGDRFGFAPAEPDCNDSNGCIVQFDRLFLPKVNEATDDERPAGIEGGRFGHFNPRIHQIVWNADLSGLPKDAIINAINGSKVPLSGSVLIHRAVRGCRFWSWSLVTQTTNSSNNLYYGSSDLTAFCTDGNDGTVLIVLPIHAIWASVYGTPANTNDPAWKPTSAPPAGHECWTGKSVATSPPQSIRPCDTEGHFPSDYEEKHYPDEKSHWILRRFLYWRPVTWVYKQQALPGVSQGNISIAPIAAATKSTFDVQAYESMLVGPGWLGLQLMYEHDRKPADDLNSLTSAFTYDIRIPAFWNCRRGCEPQNWWFERGAHQVVGAADCEGQGDCDPPIVGVRPAEFIARVGPEWSPDSFKYTFKPAQPGQPPPPMQYLPRDLNFVMGSTLRLPIIFNPKLPWLYSRQPSQFTLAPVAGLEGGFRVISHEIGLGTICTIVPIPVSCAPQPQEIFRRVAGFDASARWPYNITHNFLGDRPLTVDFSYRMRWLSYAEPFANQLHVIHNVPGPAEGQSLGGRSYTRITFIAPFSAYLQIRATWQHGELPPAFQYVGNQVTFGLTFSNPGSSEH